MPYEKNKEEKLKNSMLNAEHTRDTITIIITTRPNCQLCINAI